MKDIQLYSNDIQEHFFDEYKTKYKEGSRLFDPKLVSSTPRKIKKVHTLLYSPLMIHE